MRHPSDVCIKQMSIAYTIDRKICEEVGDGDDVFLETKASAEARTHFTGSVLTGILDRTAAVSLFFLIFSLCACHSDPEPAASESMESISVGYTMDGVRHEFGHRRDAPSG